MNNKRVLGAASAALTAAMAVVLMVPGAWAQSKFKTLYAFSGPDGYNPAAALVFDQAGNLYSSTQNGGAYGYSTVFELTPNQDGSWTESALYSLDYTTGWVAVADVIFDAAGNLYSDTFWGGDICNCGVVFEITPSTGAVTVLHNFGAAGDGTSPTSGLTWGKAGNLYGADTRGAGGNGHIFELTPNQDGSWTETILHTFKGGGEDGTYTDRGNLIFDAAGNLYGATAAGGGGSCTEWGTGEWSGCGMIFEFKPNSDGTWTEKALHRFSGPDGEAPEDALIFDDSGNLYGTTIFGGAYGDGTVFELTPNTDGTWREKKLHQFTGGEDGANPYARVIFDAAGNLYGTTYAGGAYGYGTVFELTPNGSGGWKETVLHQFTGGKDGANPYAGLIFDAAGNLYGTTWVGGSSGDGVVFEITP